FSASWEAPFPAEQPLFAADLRRLPDQFGGVKVEGTLTSNLPHSVELQDIVLLYEGKAYTIERLESGNRRRITLGGNAAQAPESIGQWCQRYLTDPYHRVQQQQYYGNRFGGMAEGPVDASLGMSLKKAMFFRTYLRAAQQPGSLDNANLRQLDESWRVAERR